VSFAGSSEAAKQRRRTPFHHCLSAVYFLWHFPAGHPGWLLATTVPCPARTFLPRRFAPKGQRGRPPDPLFLNSFLLRTTSQYSKNSLYFPQDISICFLKCLSSVLGKSLLKCTPLLSCLISAARAISRQTVSILWHSQPAGPSKILSIT